MHLLYLCRKSCAIQPKSSIFKKINKIKVLAFFLKSIQWMLLLILPRGMPKFYAQWCIRLFVKQI
ncbi:MAG: hypothetical protein COA65_00825 [Rhodospirillaceae bacterium]|nr:MAG: hypothetical protein COA65_00825 [Rhodospirillaceae bacterium]